MPEETYIVNVEAAIARDGRFLTVIRGPRERHAAGTLGLPGGRVQGHGTASNILEATARREVLEETGLSIGETRYVESHLFESDSGEEVIDVVLLCRFTGGEARTEEPREVESVRWMTVQEILSHSKAPRWTRQSIEKAESLRQSLGW